MEANRITTGRTLVYGAAALFLVCETVGGGSSRDDVPGLMLVRLSALIVIAVMLFRSRPEHLKLAGLPLLFAGLMIAVMALQLVPLPPALWMSLPGRELYAEAAAVAGTAQPWRPVSLSPDLTIEAILGLLPLVATLLLLGLAAPPVRRGAAIALLWVVVVSAFLAVLQQSGGPESGLRFYRFTNQDAGVGLLANRNHQALLMAMGIPAATWWALRPGRIFDAPPIRLAIGASLIFVCLIGAVLTGSRTGLVLCGFALLSTLAMAWPRMRRWPRYVRLPTILFFPAAAAFAAMALLPGHRVSTAQFLNDPRSYFWPRTVDMIREFLPFGAGFGTFERAFPRFEQVADVRPEYLNRAHNDFLEIGAEAGLVGYALLLLFLGWWIVQSVRVWRARPGSVHDLQLGRLGSILIGLGLLASATDYPLRTPLLGVIFAGACMMLSKSGRTPKKHDRIDA